MRLLLPLTTLTLVVALVPSPAAGSAIDCYEAAREDTPLNETQAKKLCAGSSSAQPVRCFRGAREDAQLSDFPAIGLCRCARGLQPVTCYVEGDRDTDLTQQALVKMCSARAVRDLDAACRPL